MSVAEDTTTIDQVDCLYNEFIMAGTLIRAPPVVKINPSIINVPTVEIKLKTEAVNKNPVQVEDEKLVLVEGKSGKSRERIAEQIERSR